MPFPHSAPDSAYARIDDEFQRTLAQHPELRDRWLLIQSLLRNGHRRSLYPFLPITDGMRVLDAGTGFGIMALELAVLEQVEVHAVDLNVETLHVAEETYSRLQAFDIFSRCSSVTFEESNICNLPFDDNTFDFIVSQYVYQHLSNPQFATAELVRVLKPGGHICLIDVDDQLSIVYPEPSLSFKKLQSAFEQVQQKHGGDRFVGRKLASFLHDAGLQVVNTWVQPQAQFIQTGQDDPGLQLTLEKLREVRQQIVEDGIMESSEFDTCLDVFRHDVAQWQFHAIGQMAVVGRK